MLPTRGISCLSLVLHGIRIGSEGLDTGRTVKPSQGVEGAGTDGGGYFVFVNNKVDIG